MKRSQSGYKTIDSGVSSAGMSTNESRADKEVGGVERHRTCSLEGTRELQTILPIPPSSHLGTGVQGDVALNGRRRDLFAVLTS